MILRKPYATFIKFFRLFHAVIAVFIAFILFRCFSLYNFFRIYSIDYRLVMSGFSVSKYVSGIDFIFTIFVLILTIILFSVMFYKKKPFVLYAYNILLCISTLVIFGLSVSTLKQVDNVILDVRVSKAFRDFFFIISTLEFISLLLFLIRAIGFDIKRFDFGSDLQKLDISEADSEEIEVALNFDKDEFIRDFKKNIRNFKYFYIEHKFIVNMSLFIVILSLSSFIYFRIRSYSSNYNEGKSFNVGGVTFNVVDSYILNTDPTGRKLVKTSGDYAGAVVVVRFQMKGYSNKKFNTGLTTLKIDDFHYGQKISHAKELYDLGTAYVNQKISSEFKTYIMAFEITDLFSNKNMEFAINDNTSFVNGKLGAKNNYVKLKPIDLRKNGESFRSNIKKSISFEQSILGSSNLKINDYEIKDNYKLKYNFCYAKDKCFDSYEYITPSATGSYFKTLMKIDGSINFDSSINISEINNFSSFFNNFATVYYKVNGEWLSKKIDTIDVKAKKANDKNSYIEVPSDIKEASEIYFLFKIRNQSYKYTLK